MGFRFIEKNILVTLIIGLLTLVIGLLNIPYPCMDFHAGGLDGSG